MIISSGPVAVYFNNSSSGGGTRVVTADGPLSDISFGFEINLSEKSDLIDGRNEGHVEVSVFEALGTMRVVEDSFAFRARVSSMTSFNQRLSVGFTPVDFPDHYDPAYEQFVERFGFTITKEHWKKISLNASLKYGTDYLIIIQILPKD